MVLTMLLCLALAQEKNPTPEATLAWLQSLDTRPESAQKAPRFPGLKVEDLKTLKDVRLGGHRASDNKHVFIPPAEFRFLLGLPALENADLVECDGLNDESLVFIGKLKGLRSLNLGDAQVTSAGLQSIAGLKNLETLDLGWTKDVGDAAMPLLARLPRLKVLGLGGTRVTDRGLGALEACRGLTTLRLAKTKVTAAAIDRLKKAIPGCTVTQ